MASILGGNPAHLAQDFNGALRHVAQIPERRWHYV